MANHSDRDIALALRFAIDEGKDSEDIWRLFWFRLVRVGPPDIWSSSGPSAPDFERWVHTLKRISDDEIIELLRRRASSERPMTVKEIAAFFNRDARGFSKILPRMRAKGLVKGDEAGYFV